MQDQRYDELRQMLGANDNLHEWEDAPQARLTREDYERFGRHTNYTPPSPVNKKKRKAKAKAQKQSRRKNRKH